MHRWLVISQEAKSANLNIYRNYVARFVLLSLFFFVCFSSSFFFAFPSFASSQEADGKVKDSQISYVASKRRIIPRNSVTI